jgi:hypothetical protein
MYSLNQLKTLVSCGRDPARSLPFRRGFLLIPLMLVCLALSQVQAAVDTPDPGPLPPGNTADGQGALQSLTTGRFNSAFGFFSLLVNTDASFNTGLGAGALLLNNASLNTGVGSVALLSNSGGINNTAVGAAALLSTTGDVSDPGNPLGSFNNAVGANSLLLNSTGSSNNALGESALFNNDTGAANTAVGDVAAARGAGDDFSLNTAVGAGTLFSGTGANSNNAVGALALAGVGSTPPPNTGVSNNAFGVEALEAIEAGSANVAIGDGAGSALVGGANPGDGSFNIYIGFQVGSDVAPDESNTIRIGDTLNAACFIGGISGVPVAGDLVAVDANGQLGSAVDAGGAKLSVKQLLQQQQLVQELKSTTERQAAVIALQEGQIKTLTAGLKQQADQIQKVSAQLEMIRPTPRVVENR